MQFHYVSVYGIPWYPNMEVHDHIRHWLEAEQDYLSNVEQFGIPVHGYYRKKLQLRSLENL